MHTICREHCSSHFTTKVAGTALVPITNVHVATKISHQVVETDATVDRGFLSNGASHIAGLNAGLQNKRSTVHASESRRNKYWLVSPTRKQKTVTLVPNVSPSSPTITFIEPQGQQSKEKSLTILENRSQLGAERHHQYSELAYSS